MAAARAGRGGFALPTGRGARDDALCDAAFAGKNREYALGNTPQQKSMGKWSDGVPVKEPQVVAPEEAEEGNPKSETRNLRKRRTRKQQNPASVRP
jgi:hypothetical protein